MYYNPENYGLELVGEIDWSEPCYDFNMTAVWKKRRGEYYIASDSGCSCPSPFEDLNGIEDLSGPYDKKALAWQLDNIAKGNGDPYIGKAYGELRKDITGLLSRLH